MHWKGSLAAILNQRMYSFCTYFDERYVPQGLALYESLERHCKEFKLWVLCMDEGCFQILEKLALKFLIPVRLEQLEEFAPDLLVAKGNRRSIEYYFTCTPVLPVYIFENNADVNVVTYLDADLYFFDDPKPVFEELSDRSIGIIGHRFPDQLKDHEIFGIYNVGWVSFRRDENALNCLRWWKDRCMEGCDQSLENGRFGDQKYLDDWPTRFKNVAVLEHKGANLAPWNLVKYHLECFGDSFKVDSQPLIFFHFHGLKQLKHIQSIYEPNLICYGATLALRPLRGVYGQYLKSLLECEDLARSVAKGILRTGSIRHGGGVVQPTCKPSLLSRLYLAIEWRVDLILGILKRKYIMLIFGRVL